MCTFVSNFTRFTSLHVPLVVTCTIYLFIEASMPDFESASLSLSIYQSLGHGYFAILPVPRRTLHRLPLLVLSHCLQRHASSAPFLFTFDVRTLAISVLTIPLVLLSYCPRYTAIESIIPVYCYHLSYPTIVNRINELGHP